MARPRPGAGPAIRTRTQIPLYSSACGDFSPAARNSGRPSRVPCIHSSIRSRAPVRNKPANCSPARRLAGDFSSSPEAKLASSRAPRLDAAILPASSRKITASLLESSSTLCHSTSRASSSYRFRRPSSAAAKAAPVPDVRAWRGRWRWVAVQPPACRGDALLPPADRPGSAPRMPAPGPRVDRFQSLAAPPERGAKCPLAVHLRPRAPTPRLRSSSEIRSPLFCWTVLRAPRARRSRQTLHRDPAPQTPFPCSYPPALRASSLPDSWCGALRGYSGPRANPHFGSAQSPVPLRVRWPVPIPPQPIASSPGNRRLAFPGFLPGSLLSAVRFSRWESTPRAAVRRAVRQSAGPARPPGPARRISQRTRISPAAEALPIGLPTPRAFRRSRDPIPILETGREHHSASFCPAPLLSKRRCGRRFQLFPERVAPLSRVLCAKPRTRPRAPLPECLRCCPSSFPRYSSLRSAVCCRWPPRTPKTQNPAPDLNNCLCTDKSIAGCQMGPKNQSLKEGHRRGNTARDSMSRLWWGFFPEWAAKQSVFIREVSAAKSLGDREAKVSRRRKVANFGTAGTERAAKTRARSARSGSPDSWTVRS